MFSRLFAQGVVAQFAVASLSLVAYAQAPYGQQQAAPGVNWRTNLDAAKVEAAQSNRHLLLHFTTRTCGPCKALDQTVFNQPQVAAAIEQQFVPVRIDADLERAMAGRYQIDRVPTEVVITPDGTPVAKPPIPDKPDAYVAQLHGLAQHLQQSQAPRNSVGTNPAYASLPGGVPVTPAAAMQAAQQSAPATPQAQVNPYATAPANPQVHGQAQNVYAASAQTAAAPITPTPNVSPTNAPVAQQPSMTPGAGMPSSYPNSQQGAPAAVAAASQMVATKPAPPAVKKPTQADLPPGSPSLCFDGYCPVSLKTLNKWVVGSPQFGAVHRGRTYLFAGPQQREQFLAAPDSYSPVFAGKDPVLLLENQVSQDGVRDFGFKYGDEFYLFSSKETMQKFQASPQTYSAGVKQAMSQLNTAGDGVIRR
ncbi:thioredoxin family protein [Lacipirellula parvula]|uniref:Thioredoxin domain-containing protein n=1 Tax=Lacipirellula parvula TaxID=2650471 RepID=A0A5K7XGM2_9BACT|nr:thioredoxin family protein [Lacipirellula parvula]BBO35137.1 hypothetical protein PLANPX_4749 [Lacipirellula parvula]